ncbi:hypothetical protein C1645_825779 [Glomus cerebriforme]|uniref:Uncharacterized protein n=1 Tax=Glomus cerebriforme TaxID=658196 RepID=A0A397SSV9_9GLOM|nr:hypothetical protein C1645_825779 [Glomus cerebriforme]
MAAKIGVQFLDKPLGLENSKEADHVREKITRPLEVQDDHSCKCQCRQEQIPEYSAEYIKDDPFLQELLKCIYPEHFFAFDEALKTNLLILVYIKIILSKFNTGWEEICNYLQQSISKVSLTMDMWTSISALVANRLMGITTDNEAKMIAATRQIRKNLELPTFNHYCCTAYVLNLIVKVVLNTDIIPLCIKKLRTFISTIRNSPKQMDKLRKYFRIEDTRFKVPLPDIVTRNNWPTDNKWIIFTDLLDLLALFALITKIISASSYPTIEMAFLGIKYHLEQTQKNIFQPIRIAMANYKESSTPTTSKYRTIEDL